MFETPESVRDRPRTTQLSYARAVPPSAHDIAAELRARRPNLGKVAVHKILYFGQGHHLATFGQPLFGEPIYAWDNGPVVSELWRAEEYGLPTPESSELGEAELNTIGYVLSRYGALSGRDLINLSHSQQPWKLADASRPPGRSKRIEQAWIEQYFTDDQGGQDSFPLDADEVDVWLRDAAQRRDLEGPVDNRVPLAERIRELRERAAS